MVQRTPLTKAEKEFISQQKAIGVSLRQIAQELLCSTETTRKWWRNQRDGHIPGARGRPMRRALSTYPVAIIDKAIELKKAHPHWGPISIKLEIDRDESFSGQRLPSNARLSVLFQQVCAENVQPRNQRFTRPKPVWVKGPHQRWQIDTKEQVQVGSEIVSMLELRDLHTGLMIGSQAFITTTEKRWRRLSLVENQQALRQAFQTWGLPLEVQTDHDGVYINPNDHQFPSIFTLWLAGLGVTHVTSRPYRPTDQGSIERNHRTLGDFAWKDQVFDQIGDLQQALDQHQQRYNHAYPSKAAHCQGRPPLVAFPESGSTGRPYHLANEWNFFDLNRVDAYLAQFIWTRTVTKNGLVYLGNHRYGLGRSHHGQKVSIRFLPASRAFRFESADGTGLKELPAIELAKEDILGFLPADLALPVGFQFSLPLPGV